MKRFIIAFIAAYIFLFIWGWLFNGVVLKDVYAETPNLWRSQSEMMSLFHWIMGFYAVQPIPGKLILYGSIGGLIEMIIVGAMVGTIYKPTPSEKTVS